MSEIPIRKSEMADPGEVFDAIAAIRVAAQTQRAAYDKSIREMNELCGQLGGVEVFLTGRLRERGGAVLHPNDPKSSVERLHVRIGSGHMETYEEEDNEFGRSSLPYISLTAWTIETSELVTAHLDIGEFGVSAELVEVSHVHV